MTNLEKQLAGYRLTTAEILYHLPDHPSLLGCPDRVVRFDC